MTLIQGILDLSAKSNGRLRQLDQTLVATPDDPVVPDHLIGQFELRPGVELKVELGGVVNGRSQQKSSKWSKGGKKRGKKGRFQHQKPEKPSAIGRKARVVQKVVTVNGQSPADYVAGLERRRFEDLTSVDPAPRMTLEYPGCPPACRLVDLFCPIGYGQRGMIVSPPKAGKTTLLQQIAYAIEKNHPEVEVFALLIDERPEEVTDFRRNVPCTVLASSNDHTPERHVNLAVLAIERAKRMAEQGKDVVILLDSLTRVGRAFNTAPHLQSTGRTLTGGLDAGALSIPKQLFGAARRFEEGGSLSIIASVLVDTGSRGDQVIFEEFKGTGNMELILDRKISERRLFPAINLAASGTRKEHLLLGETEMTTITALRRRLLNMQPPVQVEQLLRAMERFKTNIELVGNPQSPGSTAAAR